MKKYKLLLLMVIGQFINYCYAQEIVNGGFETLNNQSMPRNWIVNNQDNGYMIRIDSTTRHSGNYSIKIDGTSFERASSKNTAIVANDFGKTATQKIKTIEITTWVKVSDPIDTAVALFIQDLRGEKTIRSYAKKINQSCKGWQKLSLEFNPDTNTPWYGFYYGVEISRKVLCWFDDISIKVNGKTIKDPLSTHFEPSPENIQWLNTNLFPLKSTDTGLSSEDMEPIGKLCADAKIVGIGEPTHGTSEALKFKLRLLKYLVAKKGFTTIALEEVIPTCDIMNSILNEHDPAIKDSLLGLPFYKLWKTSEIAAMLGWVNQYNLVHVHKVNFIGIDMEDTRIKMSRRMLRTYGLHNKPVFNQVKIIDNHLDTLLNLSAKSDNAVQIRKLADSLKFQLEKMHQVLKEETGNIKSKEELFRLETYVRVCDQWLNTRFYDGQRDSLMADNMTFYAKNHPEDKILIWAHNYHVANYSMGTIKSMGGHLKAFFGKDYVPIGFTSAQGNYTAAKDYTQKSWDIYSFNTAYMGTYEYILNKAASSFYFLPLSNKAASDKAAHWLNMPMKHLDIGYIQSDEEDDYKYYGNLHSVFDGIVFCKKTTGAGSYLIDK